ncbi:hypothetical protein P3T73_06380 [Kiritimatiellota bacterium B12222]|nr:hypothetical protein P3T73_06380 [Kiritimatiellota bacterium B12222]
MQKYSIQSILDLAVEKLQDCQLEGPIGSYRIRPDADAEADPYASAAAVNIHYMLDRLPTEPEKKEEWIGTLQSFQEEETGLFGEHTHTLSVSAACTAALYTLGRAPAFPIPSLTEMQDTKGLTHFLQKLDWCGNPEAATREATALYTLLVLTRQVDSTWREFYSNWMHNETDPHTGLLRQGCIAPIEVDGQWTLLPYLCAILYPASAAGYSHQPLCLPWRLIDTALEVMEFHRELFFKRRGHRHLPWIFCLSRSMRQTAHRHEEVRQVLTRFIPDYLQYLETHISQGHFNGPRQIQWDLAALAELQITLPGRLESDHPLLQILDRQPFL